MSDKLGTIPYPMVGQQEGPLAKYQRQLDPLSKLTDPLWQTPARPPLAPIQPPVPAPSLGFGRPQMPATPEMYQAQLPPQGATPGVQTPPESGLSPQRPAAPASAALGAMTPQPPATAPQGPMAGSVPGPADVTQYRQNPATGGLMRRRAGGAAAEPQPGSEALAGFGGAPSEAAAGLPEARRSPGDTAGKALARSYPLASPNEWYSDLDYKARGGRLVQMTPDQYLDQVRPLKIDDVSRDNIDYLKDHITSGRRLDPLAIYASGKEDGRHRAQAAKELGIRKVPVIDFRKKVTTPKAQKRTSAPSASRRTRRSGSPP